MKTKIRTFSTICILAFAGLNVNANTTENYMNQRNSVVFENEKNVKSLKADENNTMLNGKTETIANEAGINLDYQNEAELIMKNIADLEEAKAISMLSNKSKEDFGVEEADAERAEAQLVNKMIADQEEAKAVQKLVEAGRL